jgi:NADH-quinone oxidoreductase subunit L
MFVAVGIGAYSAGMFHLMTHAFFKALLFMAAGVVIHALSGEQDIRRMGGLWRRIPVTFWTFAVATAAIAGLPPLAGFFSKDEIIANTLAAGPLGYALFAMAIVGAFLTGVYSFRLYFVVFHGKRHESVHVHRERFEGPLSMMWPLAVLTFLTIVAGWIQVPGGWALVSDFLDPVAEPLVHPDGWMQAFASILSVGVALLGIALAWKAWGRPSDLPARVRARAPFATRAVERKLYFDEAYDIVFTVPTARFADGLSRHVEGPFVLGSVTEIAGTVRDIGRRVAVTQSGLVRAYVTLIGLAAAVIVLVFVLVR